MRSEQVANLSRWHPDHGLTWGEHEKNKAKRAAGKKKFISKEQVKQEALSPKRRRR